MRIYIYIYMYICRYIICAQTCTHLWILLRAESPERFLAQLPVALKTAGPGKPCRAWPGEGPACHRPW